MSWFWGAKKKEEEEAASPQEVLATLKVTRIKTLQDISKLKKSAENAFRSGNRNSAAVLLKQNATLETKIRQLDGQIANMSQQTMMYESTATNIQMAKTSRVENARMKELLKECDVSEIDDIATDFQDLSEQSYDIGNALALPMGESYLPIDIEDDIETQMAQWANNDVKETPKEKVENNISEDLLDKLDKLNVENDDNKKPPSVPVQQNNKISI